MRYQRVRWLQDSPEFPVLLYSEVDDDGWEVRKVEEYASGHRDLASSSTETGNTRLGEDRVPSLDEINADSQFAGAEITQHEFEAIWSEAKAWFELP